MDNNVIVAKRILESKGYTIKKKHAPIFEGLDERDITPLRRFIEENGEDCIWEESLEESLYEEADEQDLSGDQLKEYEPGDIIMPKNLYSPSFNGQVNPHKVMLIQSKREEDDTIVYRGFLLSSQVHKSNKYGGYPDNIYIADYATILYRGYQSHKEAFIRVDDIVEFTNKDLSTSGVWKGKVSHQFFRFVNNCYVNYKNGISNRNRYWTRPRRGNNERDRKETA